MPREEFAIFSRNGHGILRRKCCEDMEEAMLSAKEIATAEGIESFVFDLRFHCKVASFLPHSPSSPSISASEPMY